MDGTAKRVYRKQHTVSMEFFKKVIQFCCLHDLHLTKQVNEIFLSPSDFSLFHPRSDSDSFDVDSLRWKMVEFSTPFIPSIFRQISLLHCCYCSDSFMLPLCHVEQKATHADKSETMLEKSTAAASVQLLSF